MSSANELIHRIKSGELEISTIGSEGKILGLVFEHPDRLSIEAQAVVRAMGERFIADMGLDVPAIVLAEGMKLTAVMEVLK